MDRRRYLRAIAYASTIGLAGCSAPEEGGDDGAAEDEPQTPTETPTGEPTDATPTGVADEDGDEEGEKETMEEAAGDEDGGAEEDTDTETGTDTETEDGEQGGSDQEGDESQGGVTVDMITDGDHYYFDPIGLAVESGQTVTFRNESGSHSSTAYQEGNGPAEVTRIPEDAEAWDSGVLSEEGATFEHTFETPGTYDYFCVPHKGLGMVGRIVVDEPGGPAEGSMPPDGDVPESQTIVEEGSISHDDFSE